MLGTAVRRRALRRAVQTRCQAVNAQEFRLLGAAVLDLSPRGMLVRCQRAARLGDDVIVSFRAPGRDELWLDAEAVVARIVAGQRSSDRGYCAGLEFTYIERSARHELLARLAGHPPPVPRRRLWDGAQRARGSGFASALERSRLLRTGGGDSVRVCPIVPIAGQPRSLPRGVFAA